MTAAQLREILKSNFLTVAAPQAESTALPEDYVQAGAHVLLAPACRFMDDAEADTLAALFEAAGDRTFVAGQLVQPPEAVTDDAAYSAYYRKVMQQAEWLEEMGIGLLFLTGFTDVLAAKCAVYAIREALGTDIPICVGIQPYAAGDDDEHAVKRAVSMLITLQSLGVCSVGCTGCSIEDCLYILTELQAFTTLPLFSLAEPDRYLTPESYSDYIPSLVHEKCAMAGLLHSSPAYTAASVKGAWQYAPIRPDFPVVNAVSSRDDTLFYDFTGKAVSRNRAQIEIKTEDETELKQALVLFNQPGAAPVCFSVRDIDLLEYAIMHYAGRPAVRSDEYGEITAKELGALVLPIHVPKAAEDNTDEDKTR